jgi:hypothetical protein
MNRLILFYLLVLPCVLIAGCSYPGGAKESTAIATEPAAVETEITETTVEQAETVPAEAETPPAEPQLFPAGSFENPERCVNCHRDIYNEWTKSMHASAWTDQWYQADYMMGHEETDGATDLLCGACHAPIAARTGQLPPADGSQFDETSKRGISCDFCHTVSRVEEMFNMGHVSEPGNTKIGPRGDGRSLYHEVKTTNLHPKPEFCGSCHMVIHPANGTHIIDTWRDYQQTDYAKQGITCQNCHMTRTPGVTKSPGRASLMGKTRDNIAFHAFTGGSSYAQDVMGNHAQAEMSREFLRAAAELKVTDQVTEDGSLELNVEVHNVGAGHKIPTGTTYIRIIWLEVIVTDSSGQVVYSSGHLDENNHVDPDATFFRVLFKDAAGNLTGKSWRAVGIGYDRRIPANGMDSETYRISLPGNGEYQVSTRLMYRSFTQATLDEIYQQTGSKLPPVQSVEMAAVKNQILL